MSRVFSSTPLADDGTDFIPHTSHWGAFSARWKNGELEVLMMRCGWLDRGPGPIDGAVVTASSRCHGTRRWISLAPNWRACLTFTVWVAGCAGVCHAS
jgi:hypothetical protein